MRIIRGTHGGRTIHAPGKLPVRPTTDFAKEALFNILENRLDFKSIKALDLFSGIGNLSFEMASRGCTDVTSVDSHFGCFDFTRKKAKELGFEGIRAVKGDALSFIKKCGEKYDLIVADPPYDFENTQSIPGLIFQHSILNPGGILIVEHPVQLSFKNAEHFSEQRKYGKVNFSIFHPAGDHP